MATLPHRWLPRLRERPLDEVLGFNTSALRAANKSRAIRLHSALSKIKGDDPLACALARIEVLLVSLCLES